MSITRWAGGSPVGVRDGDFVPVGVCRVPCQRKLVPSLQLAPADSSMFSFVLKRRIYICSNLQGAEGTRSRENHLVVAVDADILVWKASSFCCFPSCADTPR